ncbi:MAG: hypothetical protein ABR591_16560, partial [Candidatus Velthaea sp.]
MTLRERRVPSRCVSTAGEGELQSLGLTFTRVADELRARAGRDGAAALQLGYLVGAVRRGAAATPGIAAQLARRVEQTAALDDAAGVRRTAPSCSSARSSPVAPPTIQASRWTPSAVAVMPSIGRASAGADAASTLRKAPRSTIPNARPAAATCST